MKRQKSRFINLAKLLKIFCITKIESGNGPTLREGICFNYMDEEKKKKIIKQIYDSAFPADKSWNEWFFEHVYRDDEALLHAPGGNGVSCLFLQDYSFEYHGREIPFAYISGAATASNARHKGYMSRLLVDALHLAFERGYGLAGLIPATRRLYFLYDKFGFATVVYNDIERYTEVHTFPMTEGYSVVDPDFDSLSILERKRTSTVIHSRRDFDNIMADIAHEKGAAAQVNDSEGKVCAIAFGVTNGTEIHILDLLGEDPAALDMALGAIKDKLGLSQPMAVHRAPYGRPTSLRSRGMLRIVNVGKVLSSLASSYRKLDQVIRVTDPLIPENNGVFIIKDGQCRKADSTIRRLSLDVTVDVLTRILFSSNRIGEVFGIPSSHPIMPLMLD